MTTRRALLSSLAALPFMPRGALAAVGMVPPGPPSVPSSIPPSIPPPGLTPDRLTWPEATPDELTFMRRVYLAHMSRAAERGRFVGDIPRERLGRVESDFLLVAPAATACAAMMAAARVELGRLRLAEDEAVKAVQDIAVLSAYRPASRQFTLWNNAFPSYFAETEPERLKLPGGPLGDKAVTFTMLFVRRHMAAPGTSLHNTGRAVDLQTTQGGIWLQADRSQRTAWRQSWFFGWLIRQAPGFDFHQNKAIDEPWHWEWR